MLNKHSSVGLISLRRSSQDISVNQSLLSTSKAKSMAFHPYETISIWSSEKIYVIQTHSQFREYKK